MSCGMHWPYNHRNTKPTKWLIKQDNAHPIRTNTMARAKMQLKWSELKPMLSWKTILKLKHQKDVQKNNKSIKIKMQTLRPKFSVNNSNKNSLKESQLLMLFLTPCPMLCSDMKWIWWDRITIVTKWRTTLKRLFVITKKIKKTKLNSRNRKQNTCKTNSMLKLLKKM